MENNVVLLFKDLTKADPSIRYSTLTVGQLRKRMYEEHKVLVNLQLPDGSVANETLTFRQLANLYYEAEILEFKRK